MHSGTARTTDGDSDVGSAALRRPPKHRPPGLTVRTVRRATIPAPRALDSATERACGTVVLVAGSVGTGKTTLLADWSNALEQRGDLVGWASLDREDNDPQVMGETLLGALKAAVGAHLPAVDAETVPSRAGHAFVTRLVQLAGEAPADTWLVLDDLHLVRDPRCVELVELVVRWAPAHLHVVVGTRADPGLHLARLRLEERLVEVREHQLRFSIDDTRELLSRHDVALDDGQVRHLQELTEGWAAGVALAAVSLARGRDADAFLREFARSHRAMSGYLVEEVLASLDGEVRDFLVSTSVLEDLTPELAAAVTGRDDAGALLEALSSDNAMVTVDRVGPPTYRYHVLLRSYLGAMLESRSLRGAREVHARAARWYAAHDVPGQALRHAEAAGDLDLMSDVIHHHALHLLLDGRAADIDAAVRTVPIGDPVMTAVAALASLDLSDPEAARIQLVSLATQPDTWLAGEGEGARAEAMPEPDGPGRDDAGALPLERLLAVGLRWLSFVGDDVGRRSAADPAARLGARPSGDERVADGLTAELSSTLRTWSGSRSARGHVVPTFDDPVPGHGVGETSSARSRQMGRVPHEHAQADLDLLDELTSGGVLFGAGRLDDARTAYGAALGTARRAGHLLSALQAMVGLASVAAGKEDLVEMTAWSERVLAEAQGTPWALSPRLLPAHVFAAWGAHQVLDVATARDRNQTALALIAEVSSMMPALVSGDAESGDDASTTAARGLVQLGRLARMLEADLDLEEAADEPGARQDVATRVMAGARDVSRLSMTTDLAVGELSRAHRIVLLAGFPRLALEVEQLSAGLPGCEVEVAVMSSVRHLWDGDDAAARSAVAPLLAVDPAVLPLRAAVTAHLVKAVVAHRNAQPTVAHEGLVAALTRAAPQRALRTVLEVAPEVADVLAVGAGRFGELEPFALELREHSRPGVDLRPDPLLDVALSARELSLLRELPSLLTVAEIADARAVSRNTVKTQMRSLFQKLGVGSRRDAVAAARRLGLL
ncbi:LuxR C-terminal-related transcriptional regulator [Terracoccus sp. 273MFTsu3.1]|uniref:LuxR C-terminal-related transcriptional regulator n=1 Tax=Terracoccus sp. 273MFTsu3.1 TaxID=1172188 RepID=UPI00036EE390|nr:LuxR C-terminal-related transcriptional regulator [Terracoccus sp. 273MFTsu3.1]